MKILDSSNLLNFHPKPIFNQEISIPDSDAANTNRSYHGNSSSKQLASVNNNSKKVDIQFAKKT